MPTLRYVIADVFTGTPLAGNQLAVFTDAREADAAAMQTLALSSRIQRIRSSSRRAVTQDPDLHAVPRAAVRRFPTLGTAFVGSSLRSARSARDGRGEVAATLERKIRPPMFSRIEQPSPRSSHSRPRRRCSRRLVSRVRCFPSSTTITAPPISSSRSRPRRTSSRSALTSPRSSFGGDGSESFRRVGRSLEATDTGPEARTASSRAEPLACHLARHGRVARATRSGLQGTEIGRPSTLRPRQGGAADHRVEVGGQAVIVAREELFVAARSFSRSPGFPEAVPAL